VQNGLISEKEKPHVTYTLIFSVFMFIFGKWQIRFDEHRKTQYNRIWHILCSIFGWRACHIRQNMSHLWPIRTEYVTRVPYSVRDIYGPTELLASY
jgi:hypothetical protein